MTDDKRTGKAPDGTKLRTKTGFRPHGALWEFNSKLYLTRDVAESPLPMSTVDQSGIETVRSQARCLNCETPMLGEYCYQCGQPRRGMIRNLPGLMADFLDSVFNLDTRTARTLWPLLAKPGHLSNEYFLGRRTRYVTPLRLYLFLSVLAFLAVAMVSTPEDSNANFKVNVGDRLEQRIARIDADESSQLDRLEQKRSTLPASVYDMQRATIQRQAEALRESEREEDRHPTEVTPENPNPFGVTIASDQPWHPVSNPIRVSFAPDAFNSWLNQQFAMLLVNAVETKKHPEKFVSAMFGVAPQTLLMILPLFALLLKLFYLFKRRLYMEHLIVALHSHSFLCLMILLLVFLQGLAGWTETLPIVPELFELAMLAVMLWIPAYLLLAQKRIYGQGWPMTLVKFVLLGLVYQVLLSVGILINLIWALASL